MSARQSNTLRCSDAEDFEVCLMADSPVANPARVRSATVKYSCGSTGAEVVLDAELEGRRGAGRGTRATSGAWRTAWC